MSVHARIQTWDRGSSSSSSRVSAKPVNPALSHCSGHPPPPQIVTKPAFMLGNHHLNGVSLAG